MADNLVLRMAITGDKSENGTRFESANANVLNASFWRLGMTKKGVYRIIINFVFQYIF